MKKKRKHALTYRLRYNEKDHGLFLDIPCYPAKTRVTLTRAEKDVLHARAGASIACMNANCAARLASAFPHPVYLAVFTKTSAYIVHKLTAGKQPAGCVWYRHNDREGVAIHDKLGPAAIRASGLSAKTILLRPPKVRLGQKANKPQSQKDPSQPGPRKTIVPNGARGRAQAAGLLFVP